MLTIVLGLCFTLLQTPAPAPIAPVEGDFVIRDFAFTSGEKLPELRIHYRTLGTPRKDARGSSGRTGRCPSCARSASAFRCPSSP